MYVSGSVHKWDCVCLCAGVRLRALAAACVSLRVCYLCRESPLPLSPPAAVSLPALQSWGGRQNLMVGFV